MDFSLREHTQAVWEQIEQTWKDSQKPEGERFLGNNRFSPKSVEALLDVLAEDLPRIGALSIDALNAKWGDRQNRNWVKIITFVFSEYAYHKETEGVFWESLLQRLKLHNSQGAKQTFAKILKEGFTLLGVATAKGSAKYLSTLYLQSGIPQQNIKHFTELVEDIADHLGWWNIAYRYEAIDLAQTLYDRAVEKYPERLTLKRFLKNSCQDDKSEQADVEPIAGNILKYIAAIALEIERRRLNPKKFADQQARELYLQGFGLSNYFFLRDWDKLISVLTPKTVSPHKANQFIRQNKRELKLRLDPLELNLQLVLPAQRLWQKEWKTLGGSPCQISETNWKSIIPYPDSLEIPELSTNLTVLSDRWTWHLQDGTQQDLLEWHGEGIVDSFPLLVFDAETGDRLILNALNTDAPQIVGINEVVCYFPKAINLQLSTEVEVTDDCFPCLIADWQAKQIRLTGRSASFSLVSEEVNITVQWQSLSSDQPIVRGLQIKGKQATYLETPQIYYPLNDSSVEYIRIQIENVDKQATLTHPDAEIKILATNEKWQQVSLSQWVKDTGTYEVKLWDKNFYWSTSFVIKQSYQALPNPYCSHVQIQNTKQDNVFASLPIQCKDKEDFWKEEIKIEGLWTFEPVNFVLSNNKENQTFSYSVQADQTGCLHLSLTSLREALPQSDRYFLDWIRFGNYERLLETVKPKN